MSLSGPGVVESENTTIVVFPEQALRVLPEGAYILELADDRHDRPQPITSLSETAPSA